MKKKPSCKTGLRKNVITKAVFKRELELCRMLYEEHDGKCGWGSCNKCGVIPLLFKLHEGRLIEDPAELKMIRKEIFN